MTTTPHIPTTPTFDALNPVVISVSAYRGILLKLRDPLNRQKIGAIKILRCSYKEVTGTSINLRDAKNAIERLIDELDGKSRPDEKRPKVITPINITAVVVNTGTEKVEVDLEELQLRILSEVNTLGLAECGRILELVEVFQAWNAGYKVGVLNQEP